MQPAGSVLGPVVSALRSACWATLGRRLAVSGDGRDTRRGTALGIGSPDVRARTPDGATWPAWIAAKSAGSTSTSRSTTRPAWPTSKSWPTRKPPPPPASFATRSHTTPAAASPSNVRSPTTALLTDHHHPPQRAEQPPRVLQLTNGIPIQHPARAYPQAHLPVINTDARHPAAPQSTRCRLDRVAAAGAGQGGRDGRSRRLIPLGMG